MSRHGRRIGMASALLLAGCAHLRGNLPVATGSSAAVGDLSDVAQSASSPSPATPTPYSCSIAPSVVGGAAKGLLLPLVVCLSGGPLTLLICAAMMEEAAGAAMAVILGSMTVGGLIGAADGASKCPPPARPGPLPAATAEPPAPEPPATPSEPKLPAPPAPPPEDPLAPCPVGPEPAP